MLVDRDGDRDGVGVLDMVRGLGVGEYELPGAGHSHALQVARQTV
jgi:hypothetical protein